MTHYFFLRFIGGVVAFRRCYEGAQQLEHAAKKKKTGCTEGGGGTPAKQYPGIYLKSTQVIESKTTR